MKVLFVSTTGRIKRPYFDPSVRYRCFNLAEELVKRGYYCRVAPVFDFINTEMEEFDIYVFHRPPFDPTFIEKVQQLKDRNKPIIADYDDLIFDVENALESSIYKSGRSSQRDTLRIFSNNSAALSFFDVFTVSTTGLANRLLELVPSAKVTVIHNALTEKYKAICSQILWNEPVHRVKGRVGYFSGTQSHDKDIALVEQSLASVCSKDKRELMFVGPLSIPDVIKTYCKTNVKPLVGYHDMVKLISSCEVVIAPLEKSLFNNCKSGLKYFESAAAGCNVVATPIDDIDRFESQYLYKPESVADWEFSLESALHDFEESETAARVLDASRQADIGDQVDAWISLVDEVKG